MYGNNFWHFLAKIWPERTTSRDGCVLLKKNINFLWPKMARWDPVFDTKDRPEKVYVGPLSRSFPGNEAHRLFARGPNWGFWVGAKKFMLKESMCFFRPLEFLGGVVGDRFLSSTGAGKNCALSTRLQHPAQHCGGENSCAQRPKGSPQKGYPRSGRFLEMSLRNYCVKCLKIEEMWPFHGYPFCGYPFWSRSKPMGPEILSGTGAPVRRKAPKAFPALCWMNFSLRFESGTDKV